MRNGYPALFLDPVRVPFVDYLVLFAFWVLVAMVTWFIRRIMKAKSRPVIGSLLRCFGLVDLCASMLASRAPQVQRSVPVNNVPLAPFSADKMYVEMLPYADDYVEFTAGGIWGLNIGTPWFLDELDDCPVLPYCTANEDSLLFTNINLQVCNSPDSLFHVRTIASARGRTLRSAKADLAHFYYPITQNDSVLFLPEFLSFPVEQGFRNQSITVEIAVPVGKAVEVSDALEEYRNRTPPGVVRKRMRRS